MSLRDVVECKDTETEAEQKKSAEGYESPKGKLVDVRGMDHDEGRWVIATYDWNNLLLNLGRERDELKEKSEVEL